MNPILRNVLVFIGGWFIGSIVNMGLIMANMKFFPLAKEIDIMDPNSIAANIHLFQPQNFIMVFLAHALGTLVAAYIVYRFAASHNFKLAMGIGVFFLIGGIFNAIGIPEPLWYNIVDIVGAYIPMAYLGTKLASKKEA